MPREPKVVRSQQPTRTKINRLAKSHASQRIAGTLEPINAVPTHVVKRRIVRDVPKDLKKAQPSASMIKRAVKENNVRGGTSVITIYKFIEANYDVNDSYRTRVKRALKKLVETRVLVKKQGAKYSLSPKLKTKKKTVTKEKKPEPKKTPKKTTKAAAKIKKTTAKTETKTTAKTETKTTAKTTPSKKTGKAVGRPAKKTVASRGVTKTKSTGTKAAKTREKAKETTKKPATTRAKATVSRSKAKSGETSDKTSSDKLVWVWQYYDRDYLNYDPEAGDVVESVYQEYLTSPYTCDVRSVKSGQWEYMIDFRQMTQQNTKHESHTVRHIRRVQIPEDEKTDTTKRYKGTPPK